MSPLAITIAHYRVLKDKEIAPPGFEYRLELNRRAHLGLLGKFAQSCELTQVRRINWAQSFARRGFAITDYVFDDLQAVKLTILHQFKRAAGADPKLPEVLRFTENSVGSSLQGDVLFYYEKISVLHAAMAFIMQCGIKREPGGAFEQDLAGTGVHDEQVAATLGSLITHRAAREHYKREILEEWDESRSFLILGV
jgi:hypothetical protein